MRTNAEQVLLKTLAKLAKQTVTALSTALTFRPDQDMYGVHLAIASAGKQQYRDALYLTDQGMRAACNLPPNVSISDLSEPQVAEEALRQLEELDASVRQFDRLRVSVQESILRLQDPKSNATV